MKKFTKLTNVLIVPYSHLEEDKMELQERGFLSLNGTSILRHSKCGICIQPNDIVVFNCENGQIDEVLNVQEFLNVETKFVEKIQVENNENKPIKELIEEYLNGVEDVDSEISNIRTILGNIKAKIKK